MENIVGYEQSASTVLIRQDMIPKTLFLLST